MKEMISLDVYSSRPLFLCMGMDALLDTGAEVSVFNLPAEVFELLFKYKNKVRGDITGFGGKVEGTYYVVRELSIGKMVFQDVPFFVPDIRYANQVLIISGTVFKDCIVTIDKKTDCLIIEK